MWYLTGKIKSKTAKMMKRNILIMLLTFCSGFVFAQQIIKGTIVDEFSEPPPGATVMTKSTNQGAVADNFQKRTETILQQCGGIPP